MSTNPVRSRVSKHQYEALAKFRHELRRYLRRSERMTRSQGITPLQYQLLLHLMGYPGRDYATLSELAQRLQASHHGVVALATRCEAADLIRRRPSTEDRRRVYVHLTAKGRRCLERLARLHCNELLGLQDQFVVPAAKDL